MIVLSNADKQALFDYFSKIANRDADHLGELRNDDWVKSHLISLKENPLIIQNESSFIPISLIYLNP